MKNKYTDIIHDKKRAIRDRNFLIRAPIYFVVAFLIFKLPFNIMTIVSGILVFLFIFTSLKWRNLMHDISDVDKQIAEDLGHIIASTNQNDRFTPWSEYKKTISKVNLFSIIFSVILFLLFAARILSVEHHRYIFLIVVYASGGLVSFISLRNVRKYVASLNKLNSKLLSGTNREFTAELLKSTEVVSTMRLMVETFSLTAGFIALSSVFLNLNVYQYAVYCLAVFILYATVRKVISLRRYLEDSLRFIDRLQTEKETGSAGNE